ncbi:MAG: type II toxin-antitoxin system VapC family toxin [Treponema sp.]|jgi:predicted nucleic acid-binding protein|nr:type II toxin-antitoxin system VapC family toxin [Treponema sp.]
MNIIDSSLWLEYFADTEAGNVISEIIENTDELIIPTITIYEVFKKLLFERNEDDALFAIAHMRQGKIIELTDELPLFAAKLGKDHKLPLADSIIYATNINFNCILWTQDKHFMGLESVNYFEKQG